MWRVNDRNHLIYLTISLIGLLISGAMVASVPDNWEYNLMEGASIAMVLLATRSLKILHRTYHWGYLLLGMMILIFVARHFFDQIWLDVVFVLLLLVFFQTSFWAVSRQVLLTGKTDYNTIVGSIAMYLLLGLTWSVVYLLLLFFTPGAIQGIPDQLWVENMAITTYFSFATMTTLGYGDLVPLTPIVRVFAYLEAVTGVFFMAMVVASLIASIHRHESQ